jgi:acetyl esterase/lipase
MITWSDYSEDSEIAPSSKTHNAFYDLTGFYTTWFKTGTMPPIRRDVLYYAHRVNAVGVTVTKGSAYRAVNGPAGEDWVEVLGLLTAPGTLEITLGTTVRTQDVPAGIQAFRVPLVEGIPAFRLVRDGNAVVSFSSSSPIKGGSVEFFDPLFHAGSSMTCPLVD